jgi:hypothetical protein
MGRQLTTEFASWSYLVVGLQTLGRIEFIFSPASIWSLQLVQFQMSRVSEDPCAGEASQVQSDTGLTRNRWREVEGGGEAEGTSIRRVLACTSVHKRK